MAKCLVLGANGLIGCYVVDKLAAEGHTVRAFDRYSSEVVNYNSSKKVEKFVGDFLNSYDLKTALKGIDYVFHFISTTTPITSENDPSIDIETNIRMSVELMQLCVDAKVKRILFPSTGGAIYGTLDDGDIRSYNETDLTLPVSPYAIGKLTIENYLRYFSVKFGLDYVNFRISNPFGIKQSQNSKQGVIPIFFDKILNDQPITVFGDGSMERDYIYVEDVAEMIVAMFNKKHRYDTYNIGSGESSSVNEIVAIIEEVTGKKAKVIRKATPVTFLDKVQLDVGRYKQEFGHVSKYTVKSGIQAMYDTIMRSHEK